MIMAHLAISIEYGFHHWVGWSINIQPPQHPRKSQIIKGNATTAEDYIRRQQGTLVFASTPQVARDGYLKCLGKRNSLPKHPSWPLIFRLGLWVFPYPQMLPLPKSCSSGQ
ncbi:Solute Carrier Family 2, Facilitated Glucose Transporter Member 7 [Manis pentadactyla]|nr:Solute Carrier Family 2, Facilitated Glucose Transporter Member 7 [Manis pentadactyla]